MLVPAVPTALAASPDWGYEITPNTTKVGFNTDFNVTVKAVCYAEDGDTWQIMVDFDETYLEVIGITRPALLPTGDAPDGYPGEPTLNNTAGWVYDGYGRPAGKPRVNVTFNAWTIHFKSLNATTSSTPLNFVVVDPYSSTQAIRSGVDYLNWAEVVNGTVKIGSPTLTVNVDPSGKGTVNQVPSGPYVWDQVVNLTAVNSTAGWGWASWSGTNNDAVNPTTVTMSTDKTVTATFVELPPVLGVSPLSLAFSARSGNSNQSKTVEISNTGGGTLCWALGDPLAWSVGDNWSYWNTYDTVPNPSPPPDFVPYPNPYWSPLLPCTVNDTMLTMTVVGEDADYYYGFADWPATDPQRTANTSMGKIPACMQDASVVVNKATLDYVQQVANLTLYLPTPMPGQALVTWSYTGCHGWPYYAGKTWFYTMTVTDATGTTVHNAQAMVTGYNSTMGAWIITHGSPNLAGQIFMQQYWSDAVRNFVFQWDGGTFNAPPVDVRQLTGFNVSAPAPAVPPAWLSFDKTHGSLGIGGSEVLTVTANTSGLNVTPPLYTGSFDITAPGSIQVETVSVSLEVLPATTIEVIRNLPDDALQMDAETIGSVFDVWVNFTAPIDDFNSIGLTDLAPEGWAVETNTAWCDPVASWANPGPGNKAEYAWGTSYPKDTVFHAMYKVTIPATAKNGLNDWPLNDGTKAWAEYWFGPAGPYTSAVTGEWQKIVTIPGPVVGETRDVNAGLLTTTLVVLSEQPGDDEPEDSDSSTAPNALYEVWADDTGQYWMEASKYCYFALDTWSSNGTAKPTPFLIDFGTTAKLYAGYALDFEGDYGLVPKACTMSYAMKSVNHWLFVPVNSTLVPHPEWRLSNWKAMESVHSWQYPTGCNL
jgi:hypothetical protein